MSEPILKDLTSRNWTALHLGGPCWSATWRRTSEAMTGQYLRISVEDSAPVIFEQATFYIPGTHTEYGVLQVVETEPRNIEWSAVNQIDGIALNRFFAAHPRTMHVLIGAESVSMSDGGTASSGPIRCGLVASVGKQRLGFLLGADPVQIFLLCWQSEILPPGSRPAEFDAIQIS
jgi:hypothetical protein